MSVSEETLIEFRSTKEANDAERLAGKIIEGNLEALKALAR